MVQKRVNIAWKIANGVPKELIGHSLAEWLLFPGSFLQKIKKYDPVNVPIISIVNEGLEMAKTTSYEYELFDCRYIYTREIVITLGEHRLMYAKSSMPKTAKLEFKRRFRGLGDRPLGEMLFKNSLVRSQFELAKISSNMLEYHLAAGSESAPEFVWARRSFFGAYDKVQQLPLTSRKPLDKVLLLTEYFSPDFIWLIHA